MRYTILLPITLIACGDPVLDAKIDELGPEVAGVREGPTHRPGQPCLACHGGYGEGSPTFAFAGTVYATPDGAVPVDGALVEVTDASGKTYQAESNCVGNFYVDARDADVVFPLHASVTCTLPDGTTRRNVMATRINREGACNACHVAGPNAASEGRIYCAETVVEPPFVKPPGCVGGRR